MGLDNLSDKLKEGACVINLDDYFDTGTHWIKLYVNKKTFKLILNYFLTNL